MNLKVGQTLAKGIEKGEETTEKVQETVGSKAKNAAEEAHNKVNQVRAVFILRLSRTLLSCVCI